MNFPTCHSNLNALWSQLILEELWRLGVRDCCIAPGSRSAPLTLAAAGHGSLNKHVHFDERGLGFFALGLARQSQRPVAVITTSGTAAANLYPALVEARQSSVPLLVITADRPPELLDCGANQAIDQLQMYGRYPGATLELPPPSMDYPAGWLLTSLDQAFARSCQQGLPLHINCMFREPLYPDGTVRDYGSWLSGCTRWCASRRPYTVYPLADDGALPGDCAFWQDFVQGMGVIVVGRLEPGVAVEVIPALAGSLGWPILADIQSQLHGHPAVVPHSDLLLASATGQALLARADRLLQLGGQLVSRRLIQLVERQGWHHYVMLAPGRRRLDTGHNQSLRLSGHVDINCLSILQHIRQMTDDGWDGNSLCNNWLAELNSLAQTIAAVVSQATADQTGLSESWIGAHLSECLPAGCGLFLGNSLAVRLVDSFSARPSPHVLTNRGASGIDGLLATAAGCAEAWQGPFVALVGDLSFLHDLNSLALARRARHPLVIILLNNDGGGIFSMLPLSTAAEQAETYFHTPHGLDAKSAADLFSLTYHAPNSVLLFRQQLNAALARPGCSIIEVKTPSGQAAEQIRQTVRCVEVL